MHKSEADALDALAAACDDIFRHSLANLQFLSKKKTMFSNPYKRVVNYSLDSLTKALEVAGADGDKYILLAATHNGKVDFVAHQRLVHLATHIIGCNALQENVDATMKNDLVSRELLTQTQSIAILSPFISKFSMLGSAYIHDLKARYEGTITDPAVSDVEFTARYMKLMQEDLLNLRDNLVEPKQAGHLIMSLKLPLQPCIIAHKQEPDGRIFNGIWMTSEMKSQLVSHLAQQQAAGMSKT